MHIIWENLPKQSHLLSVDLGKVREYWVSESFMSQGQNLSVYKEQRELPLLTEPLEQATLIILALMYHVPT